MVWANGFSSIHQTIYKQMQGPNEVGGKYEYFQYIYY